MYKFSGNKLVFCSPEGKLLDSREKVQQFIKSKGGDNAEEEVEKFKCFNVSRGAKAGQNKSDQTESSLVDERDLEYESD